METTATYTREESWEPAPKNLRLRSGEVHVLRALLTRPEEEIESYRRLLSDDERERAERFRFMRDRSNFIAARGMLRAILGRYLGDAPERLSFCYNPFGKPELRDARGGKLIYFNLSHAGSMMLLAVAHEREVGIDVEHVREDIACSEIAERFFSRAEVAALQRLPAEARTRAFFDCWTRKEAYIKARGGGLSLSLDDFDVSLSPDQPAALLSTRDDAKEAGRWSLLALGPGPNYVAAVAVEGRGWRLCCWDWQGVPVVSR